MGRSATIDLGALRRLAAQGKTVAEAASVLDCSTSGVRYAAQGAKIAFHVAPKREITAVQVQSCIDDDLSRSEAAQRLGISVSNLMGKAKRFGLKFPSRLIKFKATKRELKALIDEGLSQVQMAERLGVTPATVSTKTHEYGLKCDGRASHRLTRLPRDLAEKLLNDGLGPREIADKVLLSETRVRVLLLEYALIAPARRPKAAKLAPVVPRVPEDDLRALGGLHTPGERMSERIYNQECLVLGRGYLEIARGLNKAGDVIIRAQSKCGVAMSFAIGERVPKVCSSRCRCRGQYGKKVGK